MLKSLIFLCFNGSVLDYYISEAWNQIFCDIDCPSKQIQKILWADKVNIWSPDISRYCFQPRALKRLVGRHRGRGGPVVDRVDT